MPADRDVTTVTYRSGSWVAMAGAGGWALVDVEPSDPVVASVWELLRVDDGGSGLDSLTTVVATDARRGFGLVTRAGLGISVVVAGEVTALLGGREDGPASGEPTSDRPAGSRGPDPGSNDIPSTADDDLTASAAPRRTATGPTEGGSPVRLRCPPAVRWAAFALEHTPDNLELSISEDAGRLELPLTAGVVPAGGLSIHWTTAASRRAADTTELDASDPEVARASSGEPTADPTPDPTPDPTADPTADAALAESGPGGGPAGESGPGENPAEVTAARAGAQGASAMEHPGAAETSAAPTDESDPSAATAAGTGSGPGVLDEEAGDGGAVVPSLTASAADVGPVTSYDYLFGDTVMRTVEDAAVRTLESDATPGSAGLLDTRAGATGAVGEPADETATDLASPSDESTDDRSTGVGTRGASPSAEPSHSLPGSPPPAATSQGLPPFPTPSALAASPPVVPPTAVLPPTQAVRPRQIETSGMIEAVPWATPRPEAELDAEGAASEPDLELTVTRAPRMTNAPVVGGPAPHPPILGPTVQAVHCLHAHPNPVQQERCRICGAEIEDRTPVTIPRPVLGVLRLPGGDPIVLDRSAIIGREPRPGRLVDGETAHVVKVASSEGEISRTHLEVRLEGWHVLVTDLNSTNGTTIARPGASVERLRPNEPTLVEPGTSLTLADQFTIVFEGVS